MSVDALSLPTYYGTDGVSVLVRCDVVIRSCERVTGGPAPGLGELVGGTLGP